MKFKAIGRKIIAMMLSVAMLLPLLANANNTMPESSISNFDVEEYVITQSERRTKYEQLRHGNYFAVELRERFRELFGDNYTPVYIRENYTRIFDITSEEMDMGILQILAPRNVIRSYEMSSRGFAEEELVGWIDDIPPMPLEDIPLRELPELEFIHDILDSDSDDISPANIAIGPPIISNITVTNTSIAFDIRFTHREAQNTLVMYGVSHLGFEVHLLTH